MSIVLLSCQSHSTGLSKIIQPCNYQTNMETEYSTKYYTNNDYYHIEHNNISTTNINQNFNYSNCVLQMIHDEYKKSKSIDENIIDVNNYTNSFISSEINNNDILLNININNIVNNTITDTFNKNNNTIESANTVYITNNSIVKDTSASYNTRDILQHTNENYNNDNILKYTNASYINNIMGQSTGYKLPPDYFKIDLNIDYSSIINKGNSICSANNNEKTCCSWLYNACSYLGNVFRKIKSSIHLHHTNEKSKIE